MGFKLVRDKQPEFCQQHRVSGTWRQCPEPISALTRKLGEEYLEFAENKDPTELYDILDVLSTLLQRLDPDGKYDRAHQIKLRKIGGFDKLLEWDPVPEPEK